MSFRDKILEHLQISKAERAIDLDPKSLEAFSRRDLETCIQLYLHLKKQGFTMDHLVEHIRKLRIVEMSDQAYVELVETYKLDRAARKALKKHGRRKRRQ